jgi:hypothetical protein
MKRASLASLFLVLGVVGPGLWFGAGCGTGADPALLAGSGVLPGVSGDNDDNAASGPGSGGGGGGRIDVKINMSPMAASPIRGEARYRARDGRLRLKVTLRDAVPGSEHQVFVNNMELTSANVKLVVGGLGQGFIEFDSACPTTPCVANPGAQPWPSNLFPTGLTSGATVKTQAVVAPGPTNTLEGTLFF